MQTPKLSIVTVTLDNLAGLRATVASVEQALSRIDTPAPPIEILVKDGGSGDGTLAWLDGLTLPGLRVESGPDGGIYEAMNAAIDMVTGDWVLFLNAGDVLAGPEVLQTILTTIEQAGETVNFLYADCRIGDRLLEQSLTIPFLTAHMINHQSIVFARSLLQGGYDTRYRLCADYAHLLDVYASLEPLKLPQPICAYDDSGRSSDPRNYHRMWRERLAAVWRSPLPLSTRLRLSSRGIVMWPLQYLRAKLL